MDHSHHAHGHRPSDALVLALLGKEWASQCRQLSAESHFPMLGPTSLHLLALKPSLVKLLCLRVSISSSPPWINPTHHSQRANVFWDKVFAYLSHSTPPNIFLMKYIVLPQERLCASSWRGHHELPRSCAQVPHIIPRAGMSFCPSVPARVLVIL